MCRSRGLCRAAVFLATLLLLAGCSRTSRYHEPIEAGTAAEFNLWQAKAARLLTPEERRWFEQIVQEYKYDAMRQGAATGSAAVDYATRQALDGRPLDNVMLEGLHLLRHRRSAELMEAKAAYELNERRRRLIHADDTQKLRDFDLHQEELRRKITRLEEAVAEFGAALVAFEKRAGRAVD